MNITFENTIKDNILHLEIDNRTYIIEPESSIEISTANNTVTFTAEYEPYDLSDVLDDCQPKGFKEKFLHKATKIVVGRINEIYLNSSVTYEFSSEYNNVIIEIQDCAYSIADGEVADFFDMMPISYSFPRAESSFGTINLIRAHNINRKKFLKLYRTAQLFLDYFFFAGIYILSLWYTSDTYTTRLLSKLYSVSCSDREKLIKEKSERTE